LTIIECPFYNGLNIRRDVMRLTELWGLPENTVVRIVHPIRFHRETGIRPGQLAVTSEVADSIGTGISVPAVLVGGRVVRLFPEEIEIVSFASHAEGRRASAQIRGN
jgi:hypothetical protein